MVKKGKFYSRERGIVVFLHHENNRREYFEEIDHYWR